MSTVDYLPPRPQAGHGSRTRWVRDVNELVSQVRLWASEQGWATSVQDTPQSESGVGAYAVPLLTIVAPEGRLILEPIALRTPEFDGRVDLSGYPSMARMLLLRHVRADQTAWVARTSDDVDWPQPWGRETFSHIAKGLLRVS